MSFLKTLKIFLLLMVVSNPWAPLHAATFTVNTIADTTDGVCDANCTLREALNAANTAVGADTIIFAAGLTGLIKLTSALPDLSDNITIQGPGANQLRVGKGSISAYYRIFTMLPGIAVKISNFGIMNGSSFGSEPFDRGGGILNDHGTLIITNCALVGNSSTYGGAVYNDSGTTTIINCKFSLSTAPRGGAIYNASGTLALMGSSFYGNSSSSEGDDIYNQGSLKVVNCTFSESYYGQDGGIHNEDGSIAMTNSTFYSSSISNRGSGALLQTSNTIFNACNFTNFSGTMSSLGHNISSNDAGGFLTATGDQINTDPQLTALQNNGGPTLTYALRPDSPAIDAGSNAQIPSDTNDDNGNGDTSENLPFDQRGNCFVRVRGISVDIGAVESNYTPNESLIVTTLQDETDDTSDSGYGSGTSLREAIRYANAKSGNDTVSFVSGLSGTIELNSTLPRLSSDITVQGPGAGLLTVRPANGGNYRIFDIYNVESRLFAVSISGLAISDGRDVDINTFFDGDFNNAVGGGGITAVSTTLTVTDCVISGNSTSYGGGGIYNYGGTLSVNNCTISGNTAQLAGGGIHSEFGSTTVNGSTLNNNIALGKGSTFSWGGGIGTDEGTLTVTNSTLSGNMANAGGGIYNGGSVLTVKHCTFSGNAPAVFDSTQTKRGGSICSSSSIASRRGFTSISHTLFKSGLGKNLYTFSGSITSQGHNQSDDDGNGFLTKTGDQVNTNSLLGPLQDNGGSTFTHALLAGSPAINAGDPAFIPPPTTDQRGLGFPRVQGERLDIGAYEALLLSINDVSISEGTPSQTEPETKSLNFTATLSAACPQPVTVHYTTQDSTAQAPGDYLASSGTLTFAPGEVTKTASIIIKSDVQNEDDETFTINLSEASGATITKMQGLGTITNDDPVPVFLINDVLVSETNGGSVQARFTLALSAPSSKVIIVSAKTTPAGSPEASAGIDYIALLPTTVTFNPGQITRTVNITVLGDTIDENDEKFAVMLSNATNATITDHLGFCVIADNDAAPSLSVSAPNVIEGNQGITEMIFTLKLSSASARKISVQYQTLSSALNPATAGADYTAVPLTTVIFAAGETTKTVGVTINGDVLDEENERVALRLTNPVNATLGTISDGIIVDDDATPGLSINDVSVGEGNSGTGLMMFTVTLSAPSGRTVTVNAQTGNGGSPAATAGVDYVALASTPISFAPGQTTKIISIPIYGDISVEANEKLAVILSGAVNATIADNSGIGTILNDDAASPAPVTAPSN